MNPRSGVPDPKVGKVLAERGEFLLKAFHSEYEKDPVGLQTEFWRGQFIDWRQMLHIFYGDSAAEGMIEGVSNRTRLSIPPAGPLSDNGDGYIGWDSCCHMGYIGKLE